MYGTDRLSAFEISKWYLKLIDNTFLPQVKPDEIITVRDELKAKRKLTLMLRSNTSKNQLCLPVTSLRCIYLEIMVNLVNG